VTHQVHKRVGLTGPFGVVHPPDTSYLFVLLRGPNTTCDRLNSTGRRSIKHKSEMIDEMRAHGRLTA